MCFNPTVPPSFPPGALVPAAEGAQARKALEGRPTRAACGCCNGLIVRDGGHNNTPGNAMKQLAYGGGHNGQGANPLHSKITIDTYSPATSSGPGKGRIIITTVMTAINKTVPTTKRTLSVQLEDDALEKRIHMIPAAISRYWNALPLKLDITDATCGRNIYDIVFDPQITLSRDGKSVRGTHFTVEIVNVPPQPGQPLGPEIRDGSGILQGQSYVQGKSAVFNIGEGRTATDSKAAGMLNPQADIVEAHEYGHMLGLKDEYNDHARNRGGVEYILPDGTTQQAKGQEHLMDTMNKQQDARQARYAITIAYAVQDMLNDNGRAVSRNKIIGDYT